MGQSLGTIGLADFFRNWPNRPKVTGQFYHFTNDAECASSHWAQGGTGSQTDFSTVSDEVGGAVTATTQSSTPAQGNYAAAQHVAEQYKLSLGAELVFFARIKFDEVTNSQQFVGIMKQVAAIDTAGMLGGSGGTAGLSSDVLGAFWADDGDAHIDFIYGKNVATSNANYTKPTMARTVDLVANTYNDFAFRIKMDPDVAQKGVVSAFVDGVKVYEGTLTDLCEDEEGALGMGVAVGATPGGATRSYTCDAIGAVQRAA